MDSNLPHSECLISSVRHDTFMPSKAWYGSPLDTSFAPLDHSFCVLIQNKYFLEELTSMMVVLLILADFSVSANHYLLSQ